MTCKITVKFHKQTKTTIFTHTAKEFNTISVVLHTCSCVHLNFDQEPLL